VTCTTKHVIYRAKGRDAIAVGIGMGIGIGIGLDCMVRVRVTVTVRDGGRGTIGIKTSL
jgi:hypothetical protein